MHAGSPELVVLVRQLLSWEGTLWYGLFFRGDPDKLAAC